MNKFIQQSNQILIFAMMVLMIQACGGGSQKTSQQSVIPQHSLEFLLKQAQQASPDKKSPLLVQAAGLLITERRFEKAQELLVRINQHYLNPLQMDDFRLYYGETLLALDAKESSLNQLLSVANPKAKPIQWQLRHSISLSDSYLANANYFEAAKLRIELNDIIDNNIELTENNEKIWFALSQIETSFLQQLISDFNHQRLNGWLEIVYINQRWGHHPEQLLNSLEQWKKRYPLHPAQVAQPTSLQRVAQAKTYQPKQIAVLLPLSGKNAVVGNLIHDGIIAAHYQLPNSDDAPQLKFYDTAQTLSALTPYQQAVTDGADFILGPLTKPAIEAILAQEVISVPMLALNHLENQQVNLEHVYQFGLLPEDEAEQAAQRAFDKGFRSAIAFLPDNSVGTRAENAFRNHFEQLGGELIDVERYKSSKSLKQNVQHLLGVDSSTQRKRSLQQLLGRNIEFEMRRRQDSDVIFMIANPSMGRAIKPFIDYYFAHDLPVIATSQVYSGKQVPQTDIDLNGVEFPDIPLLISELPEFQQSRQSLEQVQPEALDARGRYFALGFDSYKILSQLSIMRAFPEYHWSGLTGELSVDPQGRIHRYLTWAMFNKGVPEVTQERELNELQQQPINRVPNDPLFDNNSATINDNAITTIK